MDKIKQIFRGKILKNHKYTNVTITCIYIKNKHLKKVKIGV